MAGPNVWRRLRKDCRGLAETLRARAANDRCGVLLRTKNAPTVIIEEIATPKDVNKYRNGWTPTPVIKSAHEHTQDAEAGNADIASLPSGLVGNRNWWDSVGPAMWSRAKDAGGMVWGGVKGVGGKAWSGVKQAGGVAATRLEYECSATKRRILSPYQTSKDLAMGTILTESVAVNTLILAGAEMHNDELCGQMMGCLVVDKTGYINCITLGHTVGCRGQPSLDLKYYEGQHVLDVQAVGAVLFYVLYALEWAGRGVWCQCNSYSGLSWERAYGSRWGRNELDRLFPVF